VLVTRSEFFDGNDDIGSIGCNLLDHPGVSAFNDALQKIENMYGVSGVYLAIADLDETYDTWPFTDTVWIVTRLKASDFESILESLEPDEIVAFEERFSNPPEIPEGYHLVYVWWD
jgi:hypothetical protein